MVGRLVKDDEVWLCHEHCGESHTFLLSARELSHRLVEIVYLQLCEYLSGVKMMLVFGLVLCACLYDRLCWVEAGCLV